MVYPINDKVAASNVKVRDKKQTPVGKSADRKNAPDAGINATPAGDSAELTASGLIVSPKNVEPVATIPDKETADKVIDVTVDMMRQDPETAEAAQANISAKAALNLLQSD